MKRKPGYQPYADGIPVLVPRSGVWWRRALALLRTWVGALMVVLTLNAVLVIRQADSISPRDIASKITEMLALKQVNAQRSAGAADGSAIAKLSAEMVSLKAENAALSNLVKSASESSFGFISMSKVRLDGARLYWQSLVRGGQQSGKEYVLDVRSSKDALVPTVMPNSRLIKPNASGDLFDGTLQVSSDAFLVVSLWDRSNKRLIQSVLISLGAK